MEWLMYVYYGVTVRSVIKYNTLNSNTITPRTITLII